MYKILYITVCSDSYVPGLVALIKSILKHNPNFNFPFKVINHDKYCPLSEKSKNLLFKLYNKFIFDIVNDFKANETVKIKHERLNLGCYLSFYAFNQIDYDRVIFLDSDLIVLKNINILNTIGKDNNNDCDFCACFDKKNTKRKIYKKAKMYEDINTGLMIITKKFNNKKTFNDLIQLMNSKRMVRLVDQDIINKYFKDKQITYLPIKLNKQVKKNYRNVTKIHEDDIILHFHGPKPWNGGVPMCKEIEKIWWKYYQQ